MAIEIKVTVLVADAQWRVPKWNLAQPKIYKNLDGLQTAFEEKKEKKIYK